MEGVSGVPPPGFWSLSSSSAPAKQNSDTKGHSSEGAGEVGCHVGLRGPERQLCPRGRTSRWASSEWSSRCQGTHHPRFPSVRRGLRAPPTTCRALHSHCWLSKCLDQKQKEGFPTLLVSEAISPKAAFETSVARAAAGAALARGSHSPVRRVRAPEPPTSRRSQAGSPGPAACPTVSRRHFSLARPVSAVCSAHRTVSGACAPASKLHVRTSPVTPVSVSVRAFTHTCSNRGGGRPPAHAHRHAGVRGCLALAARC